MRTALPLRLNDLFGRENEILVPGNWHALHMTRIAAKRLRYSMELYQPCFDKSFKQRIDTVKTLQDHLGAIQDCVTLIGFLENAVEGNAVNRNLGITEGTAEIIPETEKMILEQIMIRDQLYERFCVFWKDMQNERFKENLTTLIESTYRSNADKTNDLNALERIFIDEI